MKFDILKIIADAAGVPLDTMLDIIRKGAEAVPGVVDPDALIAKLAAKLGPEQLLAVGQAALAELGDISHFHFVPKDSPGNDV